MVKLDTHPTGRTITQVVALIDSVSVASAGLACSAMLPRSVSFAGREFPVAPLMAATGLTMSGIYPTGAAAAATLVAVAAVIVCGTALRAQAIPTTRTSDVTERS